MASQTLDEALTLSQGLEKQANRNLDHIPGRRGWPIIGDAVPILRDQLTYTRRCYEEYGPVFITRLGPDVNVNLIHPDANKLVTLDPDKCFSNSKGYGNTLGNFFPNGLLLRDFSDHRMHRRIMQTAFKNSTLETYMPQIQAVAGRHVAQWAQTGEMRFLDSVKQCLLEIGSTVFLGLDLGDDAKRVNESFTALAKGSTTPLQFNIPGTPYYRANKAYTFLTDFLRTQIPAKRASESSDMFSLFCKETQENGDFYSDEDITHHINFLLFAAHDTTTSVLTSMMYEFMRNRDWMQRCRDELRAIDTEALSFKHLDDMPEVSLCFRETLRLYPSVTGMARRSSKAFEFMGHDIPANSMVTISPLMVHRLPELYPNPDQFDPGRFAPGREEHKAHPFAWFPFGGGAHKCIGIHFAEMLVKVVLFEVLRNYDFESTADSSEFRYIPFPKPLNHLPVRMTRLK